MVDFGARGAGNGRAQACGGVVGGHGRADPVVDFLGLPAAQAVALGGQGRAQGDDLSGFLFDFAHGGGDQWLTVFRFTFGPGPVVVAGSVNHEDFDVCGVNGLAGDRDARGVDKTPDERARGANESLGAWGWHRTHRDQGSRPAPRSP